MKAKKIASVLMLIGMFVVVALLSSCEKQEMEEVVVTSSDQQVGEQASPDSSVALRAATLASDVTYYSTPGVGVWTANSSRNTPLKEICGTAEGGIIKAQIFFRVGNTFLIMITKQDGGVFRSPGTAYIKSGAVCGKKVAQIKYSSGKSGVLIGFTPTFTQGYEHFYPMVIDEKSGGRYYAEPILVYTQPLYLNDFGTYGKSLGSANGVDVFCNSLIYKGKVLKENQNGADHQCTKFCLRYIEQVYQEKIVHYYRASRWFYDNKNFSNFKRYNNGGSVAPRVGDILCFGKGTKDKDGKYLGHVAVIMEVSDTYVKIAQQNSGTGSKQNPQWYPIGGELERSGNTIIYPDSKFEIQGWMRYHKQWLSHQKKPLGFPRGFFLIFYIKDF